MTDQIAYWDRVADTKAFSHPIDLARFSALVTPEQSILDLGCGFGRTCIDLWRQGYPHVVGVDTSPKMIARGKREYPHLDLRTIEGSTLPFAPNSFQAVLLFAVLTCIPSNEDQIALMREVKRVLQPGGIVYISDMPLQADARNQQRYRDFADQFGIYGVFQLPEGVACRHHDMAWITTLTADFERLHLTDVDLVTMNGNPAQAFQLMGRWPSEA